jgi:hypothetical protein
MNCLEELPITVDAQNASILLLSKLQVAQKAFMTLV